MLDSSVRVVKNHLVLRSENVGQLRAVFPRLKEATIGGESFVAVPHTLESARVLNNLGYQAPSPIRSQYEWPGRYTPRWYQVDTSEFFTLNMRCYCLSAMRTGKTLSALWAADYLRQAGKVKRTLIVAPLSTLWDVWQTNIFESFPLRTFAVLHGDRKKRLALLAQPYDFYIVNHHGVRLLEQELKARSDINLIIIDECFPAGTKVLTSAGERCIETLIEGDEVVSSWGNRPITKVFKRKATNLIRLTFEDGSYVSCTPEHPFATDNGWLPAKNTLGRCCLTASGLHSLWEGYTPEDVQQGSEVLQCRVHEKRLGVAESNKEMSSLWSRVRYRISKVCSKVLLSTLRSAEPLKWRSGSNQGLRGVWKRLLCPFADGETSSAGNVLSQVFYEKKLGSEQSINDGRFKKDWSEELREDPMEQRDSYAERCSTEESQEQTKPERQLYERTRREWYRHVGMREVGSRAASGAVSVQPGNTDENAERVRISDVLQSGLWRRSFQGSCRGRRSKSQHATKAGNGQKKGEVPSYVRVVGVQNYKQAGEVNVWNLEVAGPENYIANGKVVHNCATLRNSKAKTLWRPMNAVLNQHGIVRAAWGLTGSPTPTGPTDAFGQSKLITPEKLKGHFTAWKQETMLQVSQFKWVPKKDSAKSVARILSPSIRFERTVCTDMEPCYIERRAQLSEEQHKAYRQIVNQAATDIRGSMVTAVNAANLLSKIIQISCGVAYAADGSLARLDFGPRLSVLEELIEENNEKVLVFVPFTGVLEALATELRKRWSVAIVNGDVSPAKRTQVFREFRTLRDPWILLCHPDCMAHGLDLTTASLSIWYAPYLKSEKYQQANARTDGSKQTAKIDIARIYATPEEKRAYAVLEGNGRYQDIVLELSKERSW